MMPTQSGTDSLLQAPSISQVRLTRGFWGQIQDRNAAVTLPEAYEQLKRTARLDAFRLEWTPESGRPQPHYFWDSDIAKWIEGAAYSLSHHPDPELEARLDAVIDLIAQAQQPDGYLNIYFTVVAPEKRWTNLRDWHELYCAGHLIEAAVAYYETSGKRKLLDVMRRYADLIADIFGPDPGQLRGYPGHEEIELALVKLFRTTGERRYLELARYFIDERGRQPHYYRSEEQKRGTGSDWWNPIFDQYTYSQAHLPVREQRQIVGHAVRALYLYSGMAGVAAETGDETLIAALHKLWENITRKRMYITGGVGPSAVNEGFTFDYDLPNETAYAETCAAIALVFLAQRLLSLEADSRYADVMERALYNGVLAGVSLPGDRFFYANPLAVVPAAIPYLQGPYANERQPWFNCACCPPNLCRLIASLNRYVYGLGQHALFVHLFAASEVEFTPAGGSSVRVRQETNYPWEGKVHLTIEGAAAQAFTLALRLPGWRRDASLRLNGELVELAPLVEKGYARLERVWRPGDSLELELPMPVERIVAHPSVRQDAGMIALQRGPIVYCLEEVDNGPNLHNLALPWDAELSALFDPDLLSGVVTVKAEGVRWHETVPDDALYRQADAEPARIPVALTAVPYFAWANRGPGEMRVWIHATG